MTVVAFAMAAALFYAARRSADAHKRATTNRPPPLVLDPRTSHVRKVPK